MMVFVAVVASADSVAEAAAAAAEVAVEAAVVELFAVVVMEVDLLFPCSAAGVWFVADSVAEDCYLMIFLVLPHY